MYTYSGVNASVLVMCAFLPLGVVTLRTSRVFFVLGAGKLLRDVDVRPGTIMWYLRMALMRQVFFNKFVPMLYLSAAWMNACNSSSRGKVRQDKVLLAGTLKALLTWQI